MTVSLTNHANMRCKQRGIDPSVIDFLMVYGSEIDTDNEATTLALTKQDKKRLLKKLKKCARTIEKAPYIVVSHTGEVITAAHKF